MRSVPPGSRTVISLCDGLDFTAAPALREHLTDVLHRGTDPIILDLSHVTSCDAAGLAVLIGTQRHARLLGITMRLVAPSFPVSKALGATGLKRNFTICPDLPGAPAPERHACAGTARICRAGTNLPGRLQCQRALSGNSRSTSRRARRRRRRHGSGSARDGVR